MNNIPENDEIHAVTGPEMAPAPKDVNPTDTEPATQTEPTYVRLGRVSVFEPSLDGDFSGF